MYKLIIIDYSMSGMNGLQVLKELRTILTEAGIEMPFICCCSAYTENSFITKALAAGADEFLSKPFSVK